jgi:cystathionine gamma-synthase
MTGSGEGFGTGAATARVETRLVGRGRGRRAAGEPLNVPIVPASNFRPRPSAGPAAEPGSQGAGSLGREYSRDDGTVSWEALEDLVGDLEGGSAVCFSSGMAAIAAVLDLLPAGAKVVRPTDCYSGVGALLGDGQHLGRWQVSVVDTTDQAQVLRLLPGAALLWLETPSNPLLDVSDIARLADAAHAAGAVVAADNTFATPLLQNPLSLGADYVVHSATKFIGGHSDLLLGVAVASNPADRDRLARRREVAGATPGALECFLALRGARTLAVRLDRAQANAAALADRLNSHPAVRRVRYPRLPGHPQHALAAAQMRGYGAVLAFEVADAATADAVCDHLQVIEAATSVGGVESTIERRARLPGQEHVPAGLLRLSVGCEHVDDLWTDLDTALRATHADGDAPQGL